MISDASGVLAYVERGQKCERAVPRRWSHVRVGHSNAMKLPIKSRRRCTSKYVRQAGNGELTIHSECRPFESLHYDDMHGTTSEGGDKQGSRDDNIGDVESSCSRVQPRSAWRCDTLGLTRPVVRVTRLGRGVAEYANLDVDRSTDECTL